MMSVQNPHPGDTRHSQISVGCPTPPPSPSFGLDIDKCINAFVKHLHLMVTLFEGKEVKEQDARFSFFPTRAERLLRKEASKALG